VKNPVVHAIKVLRTLTPEQYALAVSVTQMDAPPRKRRRRKAAAAEGENGSATPKRVGRPKGSKNKPKELDETFPKKRVATAEAD
jgi:hypothetical protein